MLRCAFFLGLALGGWPQKLGRLLEFANAVYYDDSCSVLLRRIAKKTFLRFYDRKQKLCKYM